MLDITVCILSYNRPTYLREAMSSVLLQTRQPKKIIIYDNGSDERVFDEVKEFIDGDVQWRGAEHNHPVIWNFNRALCDCETKYIVLLHDDDRLCPNFIEEQLKLLDADDSLVAVSCNGFLIDEDGYRKNATLAPIVGQTIELYTCSGQVALKYAGDSCLPMSPMVYRTQAVRLVEFREEFGKVCDAVLFCDLADVGGIAYQTTPLYECRVHSGQDSSYFAYKLMNQLEAFFWTRRCVNDVEQARLHSLLIRQHTARNIKQLYQSAKKIDFSLIIPLLTDDKFKIIYAINVIGLWGFKIFFDHRLNNIFLKINRSLFKNDK
ncbi:MAG: glycosyltransferase family 2 protein [Methylococcales bacterium]|nr:MAG: glycosyltransferase family 2 protein [Methylococcales bacterium]